MGFKELLKKFKLGDINLLKIEVDNSKNIEIKDSAIVVDSSVGERFKYTLPNAVIYDDVKKEIETVIEEYEKGSLGFVRKDLALPEVGMLAAREKHKEIFKFYKDAIKDEHYHAMIASYSIIEFEDKGDVITSSKLFDKMIKKYREDARHIYNFARSGLIEGKFWYELGLIKFQGASKRRIREIFASQFELYVKFYPYAVWVSPLMSFKDVASEIRIRINRKDVNRMDIYIRGQDKLNLIEDDLIELLEQKSGISIETMSRYFICKSSCRKIAIVKEQDFKTF